MGEVIHAGGEIGSGVNVELADSEWASRVGDDAAGFTEIF